MARVATGLVRVRRARSQPTSNGEQLTSQAPMSAQTKYAYGRCEAIPALVQVATGLLNVLNWYGFGWFFPPVHRFLGYVLVGSVLLHVGVKLPDIVYGLRARVSEADVLTEIPWNENPESHNMPEHCPTRRLRASRGGRCWSLPAQASESS